MTAIVVDGATTRVIDFDDFGWSWIGFEVATSLYTLGMTGGFDDALAGTFHAKDGLVDPNSVVMGYVNSARRLGASARSTR